ncbi:hypothetical protein BDK89_1103 [Ilumatobacter fluminis]|uniref:Uncharacterized protein n=2 Tax=Ilumatobacter fluminis TaxID=467091 RepID=A0A4R7HWP2_9ACTN|nr:hypothetical protein BDK89_1103 [Ilumatobacter fluminis]
MLVAAGVSASAVAALSVIDEPAVVDTVARRVRSAVPTVGGCDVFPADNAWNRDVSADPLRADSDAIIATIQSNGGTRLHPDFGENPDYGIPYVVVPPDQPLVPVDYVAYGDESDPGPFPIPLDAPVEGGSAATGDRHVLAVRAGTCELFELYRAFPTGNRWRADSGARFDLSSNALRPAGWTSADAAGLPILPGLVRYEEVASGAIHHAIRVTFSRTQRGYIAPATHFASTRTDPTLPPMGLRLRLKASYDVSSLSGQAKVIAVAMQRYGLIVADNGSNWYFQGAPDPGWDDDDLNQLKAVPGTAFEVVDTGSIQR